ncbi:MAG TPA: hypothetical protein VF713_09500 [Thermoanaerobaculia bacterium]
MRALIKRTIRLLKRLYRCIADKLLRRKMPTLTERFTAFCTQLTNAEPIDSITLTAEEEARREAQNLRKADYFFEKRTIICEIKTLEIDTAGKLVEVMTKAGLHPETLTKGEHVIEALFTKIPKGSKLFGRAVKLLMTPLINDFNSAVKQIRDSKILFDIPDADGLLIILNDAVPISGPPMVYKRLKRRLMKHDGKGEPFHKDINRVFYVGETHAIETPQGDQRVNITLPNPHAPEHHGVEAFVVKLAEQWAAYNNMPFTKAGAEVEELLEKSRLFVKVE